MGTTNKGKCPACDAVVTSAEIESIDFTEMGKNMRQGLSYLCPECHTVLGVALNPNPVMAEMIEELADRLQRKW